MIPKVDVIHGDRLVDHYFWLREKTNPAVLAYLKAENAYTDAVMKPTKALQERLYQEMLSHTKETDLHVPYRDGDWWYYSRTEKGKQFSIFCRKRGDLEAPEQIIIDLNELAKDGDFIQLSAFEVSDDGNLLAYSKTDRHPLLLTVNMAAGHGGASGRYDHLHETAFDYAFLLTQLGVEQE